MLGRQALPGRQQVSDHGHVPEKKEGLIMKSIALILAALVLFGTTGYVSAHPPSATAISFDLESHTLTVTVDHAVKDASKHYVDKIVVELNGDTIIEQKFAAQLDGRIQEAFYLIADAEVGDEITVTAQCNVAGKKKASVKVAKPPKPKETDTDSPE
jgi:desulfoferrodoxin (superoxide reductase-like protein)